MTSTLCIRKTPVVAKQNNWSFKHPVKGWIGRRFYDHDGSLGGGMITIGPEYLEWFEGILLASNMQRSDHKEFEKVVEVLRDGNTIDMWFD